MKSFQALFVSLIPVLCPAASQAAEYEMTIKAGTGAVLDVAFAATGCAGICQDVTLACHCYDSVSTEVTYDFPHLTSYQNASVVFVGGDCDGDQYTVSRVGDSSHDTRCFTCVDGESHIFDCPDEEDGESGQDGHQTGGTGTRPEAGGGSETSVPFNIYDTTGGDAYGSGTFTIVAEEASVTVAKVAFKIRDWCDYPATRPNDGSTTMVQTGIPLKAVFVFGEEVTCADGSNPPVFDLVVFLGKPGTAWQAYGYAVGVDGGGPFTIGRQK